MKRRGWDSATKALTGVVMFPLYVISPKDEYLLTGGEVKDYFDKQLHISRTGAAKGLIHSIPHLTIPSRYGSASTKLFLLSDIHKTVGWLPISRYMIGSSKDLIRHYKAKYNHGLVQLFFFAPNGKD